MLAQLASPIGLVTAAITGIVAGVALLAATSSDSKDDVSELGGEIGKLSEKLDTLKADIDETNQSRKETSDSIDSEIGANRQLFDQLNELASVENKSQAEKKRMKNIVDQLNAAMPELNLQYEEEADKLSMTTTEVGKYITAMEQKYRLQAAGKRYRQYREPTI